MRFHLVTLPHRDTVTSESICAYTVKCRRWADMMTGLGHDVFVYGGELNDAACTEFIPCISETERLELIDGHPGTIVPFDPNHAAWKLMNGRAIEAIRERAEPTDFLLIIAGWCQHEIAQALPHLTAVEWGVGYSGTCTDFRVFESEAWRHCVYGDQMGKGQGADRADGRWYDTVIPNFFDRHDFYTADTTGSDYFLFIGRLIDRKGYQIAADVCEHLGKHLVVAGEGTPPGYGDYLGPVGPVLRARLMANAVATFVPTWYIEPFGGVHAEALLSGCPVITSPFGVFSETVKPDDGWKCHTMSEFTDAARDAWDGRDDLDRREARRQRAVARWSLEAVGPQYETYFRRLLGLWEGGWSDMDAPDISCI